MRLSGFGVGSGTALGPVRRLAPSVPTDSAGEAIAGDAPAAHTPASDPTAELARTRAALQATAAQLAQRADEQTGAACDLLRAESRMAADPSLLDDVAARIAAGSSGQQAVLDAFGAFQQALRAQGGRMAERAVDLADVARRVVRTMTGMPDPALPVSQAPYVLVADDLSAADAAALDPASVLAIITRDGGPTSHAAILARARSIPAIFGVPEAMRLTDGQIVLADAEHGSVDADPRSHTSHPVAPGRSAAGPFAPGATADGVRVPLLAIVGDPQDAARAAALGAEGVGLVRSEYLFPDRDEAPSVDEQTARYTALLDTFPGRSVVVRVLDAGGDKPVSYLPRRPERNPALGLRGIRLLRRHEPVLRDQLTALARAAAASASADLWVIAPMVTEAEEADWFAALARRAGVRRVGVMVEVPSAALLAEQVIAPVDFVSIGTNDLTQYTLAADRTLGAVGHLQDPWHPAVLRLIAGVARAGAAAGKPVGVCGEAAADPDFAVVLVGLGVPSLSMTPVALADVRASLAAVTLDEARGRARRALAAGSAAAARAVARD
ncbi:phosphoenolpyruvate--protein phosphotransferase [uncultured Amnibacterium sp.]|uniref:phosphoenolpyruvate--protein phosphotransferase n=1 Tax=uncultured Amnibacterium sp. TaxID=1631851 RepID=UPI0035CC0DF9